MEELTYRDGYDAGFASAWESRAGEVSGAFWHGAAWGALFGLCLAVSLGSFLLTAR